MFRSFLFLMVCLFALPIDAQEFGYKEIQLTTSGANDRYASYHKDGKQIVFESNRDGKWQLYTMNENGGNQQRILSSKSNDRRPTWHPYENIILFESDRSGTNEIYMLDLDSKKVKIVPIELTGNKYYPEFNLNGVELMFCHESEPEVLDIYRVHKKGKLLRQLVADGFNNRYPKTSNRGDLVMYHSNRNNDQETDVIYSYNNLKETTYKITFFKDDTKYASWPTVSNRVLISTIIEENINTSEIYTMQSDGSRKRRLTFNSYNDILPDWSPDEETILVTRDINGKEQIVKILMKEPIEEDPDKK